MNKTKKFIFKSASKTFSEKGYDGATMDDIAAAAGVSKGTLYYHFKSKQDIFEYIVTEGMKFIKEELVTAVNRDEQSLDKLKTLCKVQLQLVYDNKDFFKVIMSQLWGQELRNIQMREAVEEYISTIEKYLRQAMESETIEKGEVKFMAYTFFGNLCSAVAYELINKDQYDLNEVIDKLIHHILNGIKG